MMDQHLLTKNTHLEGMNIHRPEGTRVLADTYSNYLTSEESVSNVEPTVENGSKNYFSSCSPILVMFPWSSSGWKVVSEHNLRKLRDQARGGAHSHHNMGKDESVS